MTSPASPTVDFLSVIEAAFKTPSVPGRAMGCGRAYVVLTGLDRKAATKVAKACKNLGLLFQRKAYYGLSNAIYVGYDNCSGREFAKAEAIAAALSASGIPAYFEACAN